MLFLLASYIFFVAQTPASKYAEDPLVQYCMEQTGVQKLGWTSLVLYASDQTDRKQEDVWNIFIDLEEWPTWSKPLHESAQWVGQPGWSVGNTFEQQRNLGFPLGQVRSKETVMDVRNRQYVAWWKKENGVTSCHVWSFIKVDNTSVIVSNVEVQDGIMTGLIKPFVTTRWQDLSEESLYGLLATF